MRHALSFAIPGLLISSVWLGPALGHPDALVCLPLVLGFVGLPLVQVLRPRNPFGARRDDAVTAGSGHRHRWMLALALPAQLAMVGVATAAFTGSSLSPFGKGALLLVTGVFSASFAITAAHELIHRRNRLDRNCGGALLSTVAFGTFKIVHLQIHHPFVGTPLDFATARRGQSIYSFWLQSFVGNTVGAWRCERARLARSSKPMWRSELAAWYGLTLLWLLAAGVGFGWAGGVFFLAQGVLAIMYLDCINYLQHYGLTRAMRPNGRPEPMRSHHSWTIGMYLDDLLLFNLPRHAHHHTQPHLEFRYLHDTDAAPRYPLNYSAMTLLMLIPALFRRVVHPCLDRFQAGSPPQEQVQALLQAQTR